MPTIAQKLCNEIVQPTLKSSSTEITFIPSRKSFKSTCGNSSIRFTKPTKSVVIEKKRVISQIEPTSRTAINKLKSQEIILKKNYIETGVNTLISGPLRCDNNCVTNVRKRENHCSCKNGKKKNNFKNSSKQVQTLIKSCSRSDKACDHCINTSNCGTQFIENIHRLRPQVSNTLLFNKSYEHQPQFSYKNTHLANRMSNPQSSSRICRTVCQNAKRWALSHCPTKGPDF